MDRLKALYPNDRIDVLLNKEKELLLLITSNHVTYKKQDLGFLSKCGIKTGIKNIRPSDVVRLVRPFNVSLYTTDIESIVEVPGGYEVNIHPHCLIHYGVFKIKYREYIKQG